jgi:hypothetical protein
LRFRWLIARRESACSSALRLFLPRSATEKCLAAFSQPCHGNGNLSVT